MDQKSVLVSGGGIAGSALAFWLASAGWSVTVVERDAGVRSSGNPIDVRGEAATVAHEMGIWPRLEAAATGVERLVVVDTDGRRRAMLNTRQQTSTTDEVEVARADLAAALLDSILDSSEIIFHDSITALHQDHGGVHVEFENAPNRRFDLVVGADGLHSAVRRLAFGPEERFAHPFGMFVGTVRTSMNIEDPHEVMLYNEPGTSLSIHPAGGKPLAAFIFRGHHEYDHHDPEQGKRLVQTAYAGGGWLSSRLLTEWHATITLLGDAASCLSLFGEGSSNAIVGAKTLADALATHHGDHAAAFATYETTHRPRIRHYQRGAGPASHFLVPATRFGIALRNAGLRTLSRTHRQRASTADR